MKKTICILYFIAAAVSVFSIDLSKDILTGGDWGPEDGTLGTIQLEFLNDNSFHMINETIGTVSLIQGSYEIQGNRIMLKAHSFGELYEIESYDFAKPLSIWEFVIDENNLEKSYKIELLNGEYSFWRTFSPLPAGKRVYQGKGLYVVSVEQKEIALKTDTNAYVWPGGIDDVVVFYLHPENDTGVESSKLVKGLKVRVLARSEDVYTDKDEYWYYCKLQWGSWMDPYVYYFWVPESAVK